MSAFRFFATSSVVLAALIIALAGCGSSEAPSTTNAIRVAQDARYAVWMEREGSDETSPVRLRIDPSGEWHIAPEAPATLRFETAGDAGFDPAEQKSEDALVCDSDGIEFAVRKTGTGAPVGDGHLKFGICKGESERCIIVRRSFPLPPDL